MFMVELKVGHLVQDVDNTVMVRFDFDIGTNGRYVRQVYV